MSHISDNEFQDDERFPDNIKNASDSGSFTDPFPIYMNSPQTKTKTKLCKLIKVVDVDRPAEPYPRNIRLKTSPSRPNKCDSFELNTVKDFVDEDNLIIDPLCEKGLIKLLCSMKNKISILNLLKNKPKGGLTLIKSKLKMRRKSDFSGWSGGASHLERVTSFMAYDYTPAIAIQEVSSKKESVSGVLKNVVDTMLKHKIEHDQPSPSRLIAFAISDINMKACSYKEVISVCLEDEAINQKLRTQTESLKEFLKACGFIHKIAVRTPIMIVDEENLKEYSYSNANVTTVTSPHSKPGDSLRSGDVSRKASETTVLSKTKVAFPAAESIIKEKNFSVIEHKREHPSVFELKSPPKLLRLSPPIHKLRGNLSHQIIRKSSVKQSFENSNLLKDPETKNENSKEEKPTKSIKIQTELRKKLAHIVDPKKNSPQKDELDHVHSADLRPKFKITSMERSKSPNILETKHDKKRMVLSAQTKTWSQRVLSAGIKIKLKDCMVYQIYNQHNINQVPVSPNFKKAKNPLAQEHRPLNKRKFILPRTIYGVVATIKQSDQKISIK